MDLSIDQLNNLKQQHEEEIKELQRQLESLASMSLHPYLQLLPSHCLYTGAKNRYTLAKNSISDVGNAEEGTPLMIPLNQSLYVPGNLSNKNKVIVELGTGYFCEKSIEDAKELIDRKVEYFICVFNRFV